MIHPPGELFTNSVIFAMLLVATALLSTFLDAVNITFFFIRRGSLAPLILGVATLIYQLKLISHLFHGIATLSKPWKAFIFIIAAALVFLY